MLLCIIMVMGAIVIGLFTLAIGMLLGYVSRAILVKDVKVKTQDFVSWYTEDARKDVELYIREKKGAQIKKRILIETFKKNVSNPKFADIMANTKALMPPDAILGNLAYVTLPIAA